MADLQHAQRLVRNSRPISRCRSYSRRLRLERLEDRRLLAVLTVNSPLDNLTHGNGLVTLREAIIAANTDTITDLGQSGSGADTIVFDATTFDSPKIIALTLGQFTVTKSLSIQGLGALNLTLSGNHAARIFLIDDGDPDIHITVEIDDVTLTNGNAVGGAGVGLGGAIYSQEHLVLRNSVITGNVSDWDGGGVFVRNRSTTTFQNTIFSANYSGRDGGGVAVHSTAGATTTIENSSFVGNSAARDGGGIKFRSYGASTTTVQSSTLSGNSASFDGGAISVDTYAAATASLRGNVIASNSTGYRGAGVSARNYYATLAIEDSTLSGNMTSGPQGFGGGIYARNFGTVSIASSTISGNVATVDGGGIYSRNFGAATVQNSTLSGNAANRNGGGLWSYNVADLSVRNSTLSANVSDADSNGSGAGGGVWSANGVVSIRGSIVAGNHDHSGQAPDISNVVDAVFSLIGNMSGSFLNEAPLGSPDPDGNLIGGPSHGVINALIGPLANNGGPTQTHALLSGSPAIDAGDPGFVPPPDFDQRGAPFARVSNGGIRGTRIDMGAFEIQAVLSTLPGDYDLDHDVDQADYLVWRQSFGSANSFADGNHNGLVDAADYIVWRDHLGTMSSGVGSSAVIGSLNTDSNREGDANSIAPIDVNDMLTTTIDAAKLCAPAEAEATLTTHSQRVFGTNAGYTWRPVLQNPRSLVEASYDTYSFSEDSHAIAPDEGDCHIISSTSTPSKLEINLGSVAIADVEWQLQL